MNLRFSPEAENKYFSLSFWTAFQSGSRKLSPGGWTIVLQPTGTCQPQLDSQRQFRKSGEHFPWNPVGASFIFLKTFLEKFPCENPKKKKKSFCKLWNVACTALLRKELVWPGQEFWKVLSASGCFVCSVHWPLWLGIHSSTKGAFLEWREISQRPG